MRKVADWPKLGAKAKKFHSVLNLLTSEELATLRQVYLDLDRTSDEYLFDRQMMDDLANRFKGLTGKRISGSVLAAVIVAQRKRGNWVKIREPFGDIQAITDTRA